MLISVIKVTVVTSKKVNVWLYRSGCWTAPAHWRDPTTAPTCGLLAAQFPAWPVAAVLSRPGHRRFLSVDQASRLNEITSTLFSANFP